MLRREPLSLPYADQVPLLARVLDGQGSVEPREPRRLVTASIHHNVTGYLVEASDAGRLTLPETEQRSVVEFHGRAILQTAVLRRELGSIADPLEQACEAPPLAIKGPAVAQRFYPDWRLRPCTDLDLLVPAGRLEEGCGALEALGYERVVEFRPGYAERHGHDLHLRRRVGSRWWVDVELHWRVGDDPASAALTHDRLRSGAGALEIEGGAVAAPAAPLALLVLAVHLLSDRVKRLAWVNDLVLIGRALEPDDWERAFAAADDWGLLWPLHRALDYAKRHLDWERPRPRAAGPALRWGPIRAVEELDLRAAPHLGRLVALPWRERLAFLRAVLVPTRDGLRGTVGRDEDEPTWRLVRRHARKAVAGLSRPPRR